MPTVDEYIEARIPPEQQPIVQRVRELMRECAPKATELISYDMVCWKGEKRLFAHITSAKSHVTLGFIGGVDFDDKYHLLQGTGRGTRHVKIKSLDTLPAEAVCDYIRQAVALELKA